MKLKSFGCSFIYGSELSDENNNQVAGVGGSKLTWPALIAEKLGVDYGCWANGGVGNLWILNQILHHAAVPDNDLYVIGWTWIDRFDYVHAIDTTTPWRTLRPSGNDKISTEYFKQLHSQYRDLLTNLIYVQTAIDLLNRKNIPFIMTCMDESMMDVSANTHSALSRLSLSEMQEYIKPFISTFDGTNFLNWSQINNFPISSAWHPLEDAHKAAANLMLPLAQRLV